MQTPINTAIVAFGLSGKVFHAPFIHQHSGFQLTKVVERSRSESKETYPYVEVVRNFDKLLEDKSVELLVITTPNKYHYLMAKAALEAGKHVILEKPFTVTLAEARELTTLAKKQERVLTVYQNRRWDGDFLTVKGLVEQQLLGRVVEYESHFDRFRPQIKDNWREEEEPGSGILYDLGAHLIDQALHLFGTPAAVYAHIQKLRPQAKVDDTFEIQLYYNRLKVILKAGTLVKANVPRFIIHGEKGSFVKYGLDPQEAALRGGAVPNAELGREPEEHWGELTTNWQGIEFKGKIETLAGNYMRFYQNVYEAIRENKELIVKPEEGCQTIQVIELAGRSNEEGRVLPFKE